MRGKPAEKLRPGMPRSVAEVLRDHVVLELESIDRMYLNVYVPVLQAVEGVLKFIRIHRGHPVASTAMVEPITRRFVESIERYVRDNNTPMITFEKGQRKDDIANPRRAAFTQDEGVVFVGKAQEKCTVYRTEKRHNPRTRKTYAWIVKSTALVNHYYFYCLDRDFGPFFLKFCSYFPYNAKLCLNGHEYVKRQLERRQIEYQALDNGILACADPTPANWKPGNDVIISGNVSDEEARKRYPGGWKAPGPTCASFLSLWQKPHARVTMIFRQFHLPCLAHASYLIGDETTGTAVVAQPFVLKRGRHLQSLRLWLP